LNHRSDRKPNGRKRSDGNSHKHNKRNAPKAWIFADVERRVANQEKE
jgi:hypothetical protein